MKHFLVIIVSFLYLSGYAQQGSLKKPVSTKDFPVVSFIWNEYNPEVLSSNQFNLKENGKELTVTCESIPVDSIPQKNKTILFLWEDLPIRKNQFDFTQSLLYYFFDKDVAEDITTTFNIAVFNRKQGNEAILKSKLQGFTSNKEALKKFVAEEYIHDNTNYRNNPNESDLFLAIKEGLDLIGKESRNNTRAIFVITAGHNLFVPGAEISPIISQSLQNRIPIYVINFPTSTNESTYISKLIKDTYGQLVLSDGDPKMARGELLKCFNELNRRHYGQDYKITFTSLLKRDGNSYPLVLNLNGANYDIIPYKTPNFSLIIWVKTHLILFLILLVIILAIITLGIIFGMKFFKKRTVLIRGKKQEEERRKAQLLAEQENLKRKLNATQEELQRQQRATEQEKKQKWEQEQEERLTKLMHTKNMLPRLIMVNGGETFNVSNATTIIGREEDNDIVLSDSTVSKHHAQIVFDGSCFEIYDLNSSNGIIVNGNYIESAELKNSDVIQLGEVIIKFYL